MNTKEGNIHLSTLIDECRRAIGTGTDLLFIGYEYESSVVALMEIVLHHAEAFRVMAKDEVLFPFTAASCARSALEAASTIAWICQPKDIIDKEGRWLSVGSARL